jgi:hypothetical protein
MPMQSKRNAAADAEKARRSRAGWGSPENHCPQSRHSSQRIPVPLSDCGGNRRFGYGDKLHPGSKAAMLAAVQVFMGAVSLLKTGGLENPTVPDTRIQGLSSEIGDVEMRHLVSFTKLLAPEKFKRSPSAAPSCSTACHPSRRLLPSASSRRPCASGQTAPAHSQKPRSQTPCYRSPHRP